MSSGGSDTGSQETYPLDERMAEPSPEYRPIEDLSLWMLKLRQVHMKMGLTDRQEDLEASEPHVERDASEAPLIEFCERSVSEEHERW